MHRPRYRLTKAGKLVCVLLILMIAVAVYLVADRYYSANTDSSKLNSSHTKSGSEDQSGQDETNQSGSADDADNQTVSGGAKDADDQTATLDTAELTDIATRIAIYFEPESSTLTQSAKDTLNQFIDHSTGLTEYRIILEANCATVLDAPIPTPARTEHQALAEARGNTVARYLEENNLKVADVVNFGADNPDNDNSTFTKRTKNRRVDIYLYQ